jgi:hypothetical protein
VDLERLSWINRNRMGTIGDNNIWVNSIWENSIWENSILEGSIWKEAFQKEAFVKTTFRIRSSLKAVFWVAAF